MFRVDFKIENGLSTSESTKSAQIRLEGWRLRDLRFADDTELVLAVSNKCKMPDPLTTDQDGY